MEWIKDIVNGIIDTYKTTSPYTLCRHLNITIEKVDPNCFILCKKKSIYYRNYCDSEIIFIRDDLYGYEEEFILRHELGHAILHSNIPNSNFLNINKIDKQANYFALLLSDLNFNHIDMEGMSLSQIASYVNVPYEPLAQLVNL